MNSVVGHDLGETVLQIGGAETGVEGAAEGYGYIACLLRYYYGKGVGGLGDTQRRAMAQTECAGNIAVVAHGQDAAGAAYAVTVNDHGAVMERRVLEEYILDKARIDIGIDNIATLFITFERHFLTYHDERAGLGLRHIHARIDDRENILAGVMLAAVFVVSEQPFEKLPSFMVAQTDEKPLYLILKQYDEHKQSYSHKLVEYGAYELEIEYL